MPKLNATPGQKRLEIDGKVLETPFPVEKAWLDGGYVIVLFDPESNMRKFGQFPNLVAYSPDGREIWKAELPTHESGDCYLRIVSERPLAGR